MKRGSGLLLVRRDETKIEVLLGRMGGPLWADKAVSWSIPKGDIEPGETPVEAALREFQEEVGIRPPLGPYISLGTQPNLSGEKIVEIFAAAGDVDLRDFRSNMFSMEWPAGSGFLENFPEMCAVSYFTVEQARAVTVPSQTTFLYRVEAAVNKSLITLP
jgi:predicted NUDIX family NTP pyrophosphohydrolase